MTVTTTFIAPRWAVFIFLNGNDNAALGYKTASTYVKNEIIR